VKEKNFSNIFQILWEKLLAKNVSVGKKSIKNEYIFAKWKIYFSDYWSSYWREENNWFSAKWL